MKSVKCSQCGFVGWADTETCKACGAERRPAGNSYRAPDAHVAYQPSYGAYYGQDLKTGLAKASLVLGILNLAATGIFLVPSIVGIVLARKAQKKINEEPDVYGGQGMATAGLVTNIVAVAFMIPMAIIMAIAIPNLLASRRAANEGASIAAMRTIHSAEATYQSTNGRGSFGTLEELAAAELINPELAATGRRYGYKFKLEVGPGYASLRGDYETPGFHLVAVPQDYGSSGIRSFYVDETGVIRGEDTHGREATALTPPLDTSGYSSRSPGSRSYDSRAEY